MSILIKGMKMPKSCLLCPFGDEFGKCCVNAELEDANELTHSCPLVELPTIELKPSHDWNGWENGCGRTYDVQPKKGKWIKRKDAMGKDIYICSNCETEVLWRDMRGVLLRVDMQNVHFCPNCGAKMERSEDGEIH